MVRFTTTSSVGFAATFPKGKAYERAAPFSLRLGHARGKTIINGFLTPSRRFATQGEGLMRKHCINLCYIFLKIYLQIRI